MSWSVARGATSLLAASLALVGCGDARELAPVTFMAADGERLVVMTDLPAPGFWSNTADTAGDEPVGFEHEIAALLAERFGLELVIVDAPFTDIVAGRLGDADLAIAQISVTSERAEMIDFSVPYYRTDSAVIGRIGAELTDLKTARELRWVAEAGSTQDGVIAEEVRPDAAHLGVTSALGAAQLILDGEADVALVDLPTAFAVVRQLDPEGVLLDVIAAVATGESYAVAVPKDASSDNLEVLDAALRALEADGTLAELIDTWLIPLYGTDPADLPIIRIR